MPSTIKDDEKLGNLALNSDIERMPIVNMSASSIAQVCGIPRSQVLEILKEIFMKVVDVSKQKEEVILDLKIGEICITEKHELIFRNKDNLKSKTTRKQEVINAIRDAEDSYMSIRENPNTNFDVNKIASDVLSMGSATSYYVSVQTPRTKTRSVISSKFHGIGSQKRKNSKWSLFKKGSDYCPEMHKTADGFNSSHSKSKKRLSTSLSNSRSYQGISNPKQLFTNNGIIDKINDTSSKKSYGL